MKKNEIKIGATYNAKVSNKLTTVRVEAQTAFTNKIVGATLGAYFTAAVS